MFRNMETALSKGPPVSRGKKGSRGIIYAFRHVWQTNRLNQTASVVSMTGRLRESFVRGTEKPDVTSGQGMWSLEMVFPN